ncbi:RNA-directed DNA polymerase [Aquabacterium soli]|uniref:RNA-directed DNA polymerase n=1 Tax=Aquabacterium soli TaxID=2493092 RepID=A0A3R8T5S5_9BURK|nr:RNA-directed DNA polymerase [Aquabacterium soli]RRS04746.1 RNA-directed DNA polymerase [Aquabacterium soli]
MTIDLGTLQLDEQLVTRQLQRDMRDDWFPDPLRFEDIFDSEHIAECVAANFTRNNGVYRPSNRQLLNLPKPNFTLRYALETSIVDRAIYHGLTALLVPHLDPLIPWNVFSHRHNGSTDSRYLFKPAIRSWQDFTGVARQSLEQYPVLLSTDLANYFENISIATLKSSMLGYLAELKCDANQKAKLRSTLELLFSCLTAWCKDEMKGLPQNRDASSFLANMYMLPVDRAMASKGYKYFRYMDDIKIACSTDFEARSALKFLSLQLREAGLSINSGKTSILHKEDEHGIDECLDSGGRELQEIAAAWSTRKLIAISRTLPDLRQRVVDLLDQDLVASREFRYYIRRLRALATCPEFQVPEEYFNPITERIVGAVARHPAATDQLVTYLQAVPTSVEILRQLAYFLLDCDKSIYTWQNYQLWVLLAHKNFKDSALRDFAKTLIAAKLDSPSRSGAVIYLGATGDKSDREVIAQNFANAPSFLAQRNGLIAVQDLHFAPMVRDHVAPHLRDDLKGVFRRINRRNGKYTSAPEPISITSILDVERDYE